MQDIAKLGISVKSDGVVVATDRMDKMTGSAKKAEKASERMSEQAAKMGKALSLAAVAGGAALTAMTVKSIKLAVAAEETASKFQVVFRGSVVEANARLMELTKTIPLTLSEMRDLSAGIQDMLVPMGVARKEATKLSLGFVELAGDIAAFSNVETDVVLRNIQSALAGSSEPMRKFGIDTREGALQAIALSAGLIKVGEELDTASRAQAVFLAIQKDSADAVGYSAAEMDQLSGQMRIFSRDIKQAQEDLGRALLPLLNEVLTALNKVNDEGLSPLQRGMIVLSNAVLTVVSAFIIVKESALFLGEALVGLAANIAHSLMAIATPFVEFIRTMGAAAKLLAAGEFSEAAAAFDGLGGRIVDGFKANSQAAADALGFIGESFESRVSSTVEIVSVLMTQFSTVIDRGLEDVNSGMGETGAAAEGMSGRINTALKSIDSSVMKELEDNFAFLTQMNVNDMLSAMQKEIDALEGGAEAWRHYSKQMFIAQEIAKAGPDITEEQVQQLALMAGKLFDVRDAFGNVVEEAETLGDKFLDISYAAGTVFKAIQNGVDRGSKEYKKLEVALEAANLVAAIGAVLNQANGDPYTAGPRMAAMAAVVSSLIGTAISVGGLSGGFTDTAAQRQESQGTGTVLGDATAKSESIANAMEMTADATSKLVGINRGMLNALQTLNAAIGSATGALARGSVAGAFSDLPTISGINKYLGGKVKISDQGIAVMAGTIEDLIGGGLVMAFREVQKKKNIFSSVRTKEELIAIGDSASDQFSLIFQALADTVMEGGIALGLSADELTRNLESLVIAEQRISLKDLSAEDQQAEIEAVIGAIFDEMVVATIPFIDQFQQVGEGLGETLVRVATSVQVFEESVGQLGFSAENIDPEQFAQMAVGLVDLAGGVSEFIAQFTNFTAKFATDEHNLSIATNAINTAFERVGLVLPATADGMWALMQSLDASTEAGREQIATLLELTDYADQYYKLIEKAEKERLNQARTLDSFIGNTVYKGLIDLRDRFNDAMAAADALNASQREYSMIARSFNNELKRMAAQLTLSVISMTEALFGQDGGITGGIEQTNRVANVVFDEWMNALERISDFTKSILLDDQLTTLTPAQKLSEAQSQFDALMSAAMGGDVEAANALPDAAKALLREARFMFASGQDYTDIFNKTLAALDSVQMPGGISSTVVDSSGASVSPEVSALVSALERYLQASELAETLRDLSQVLNRSVIGVAEELGVPLRELVQILGLELGKLTETTAYQLGEVATQLGASVFELAEHLDISIDALADVFGVTIGNFSAEQFQSLARFSSALGVGIEELATVLDINLGRIEDSTSLLSRSLDLAISKLPDAIQADLGPLLEQIRIATTVADSNAAIGNLGNYILSLPQDLSASLTPFLELIGFNQSAPELTALMGIERNTANIVTAIHDLVSGIGGIVTPVDTSPVTLPGGDLLPGGTGDVMGPIWTPIEPPIGSRPGGPGFIPYGRGQPGFIPGLNYYEDGGYVPNDGAANLHAGEFVVTRSGDNLNVQADPLTRTELKQIRQVLVEIKDQNKRYQESDLRNTGDIASSAKQQAEYSRRMVN